MTSVVEILSSGLSVARLRVNVLASNIANAETTKTSEGGPYKRKDVVQVAHVEHAKKANSFEATMSELALARPAVERVVEDQTPPKKVYEPGHPDADANGYVAYPNINVVTTMTDLMSASRLYQANVTALETVRGMERDAATLSQA